MSAAKAAIAAEGIFSHKDISSSRGGWGLTVHSESAGGEQISARFSADVEEQAGRLTCFCR